MNRPIKAMVLVASIALPLTVNAQSSRWKMFEETDRMTDEVTYIAMTKTRDSSQLVIQCTKDYVAAYVKAQWLDIDIREDRTVRYRFDRDEVREGVWRNVQRGGGAVTFGDEAIEIARRAVTANRIVVDNGTKTVEFSLAGAGQAIKQVAAKCPKLPLIRQTERR